MLFAKKMKTSTAGGIYKKNIPVVWPSVHILYGKVYSDVQNKWDDNKQQQCTMNSVIVY